MPSLRDLVHHLPQPLADRLRGLRGTPGLHARPPSWADDAPNPWAPDGPEARRAPAGCNLCRWYGDAFLGAVHGEAGACPRCGSSPRDRFLFWCFVRRTPPALGLRILETSPRVDRDHRRAMARWFDYRSADGHEGARRGTPQLDLQAIDLPDRSVDVLLAADGLDRGADTDRALGEIRRILAPGGRMYLQVPVVQGATAPPAGPELHGDDLTDRLRVAGFTTTALVAQAADAARLGAVPAHLYLAWECLRDEADRS